jgi:hypothetical protein
LKAEVNPENQATTSCRVEYGLTTAYETGSAAGLMIRGRLRASHPRDAAKESQPRPAATRTKRDMNRTTPTKENR